MTQKDHIDAFGAGALICFALLLAFNQVVIKVVNDGMQPVFFAGMRSAGATVIIALWLWARGVSLRPRPGTWPAGLLIGSFFAAEFLLLFLALDLTTVTRSSVIFYSMPVWLALAAHVLIPGQALTRRKAAGLALAFAGVVWAIADRGGAGGQASLIGDICALGAAMGWAGIALCAKGTVLRHERPEIQLLWQVGVSAPLLLLAAPFFGPFLRDPQAIHLWGFAFQTVVIVSIGFPVWLWLLGRYPAAGVASFSFLTPVFGVGFGWGLLGEDVAPSIIGALVLVVMGIILINRPARRLR